MRLHGVPSPPPLLASPQAGVPKWPIHGSMRRLIVAVVCAVLAMMAVVGIKEGRRPDRPAPEPSQTVHQDVATISTGERVDIEQYVATSGLTVIEFTAHF